MPDKDKAKRAFEDQAGHDELVVIDEDGNVHPADSPPPGKKTTILRDPKGEY